jgi:polar amino acid transport system substrate-binding protein
MLSRVCGVLVLALASACAPAAPPPAPTAPAPGLAVPTEGKLGEIRKRGSVNLFMEAKFKPYEFVDDSGQIVGIDVDLARKLYEQELGITVNITDVDFPGLITSLVQGKADMIISGIGATQERMKSVDFSIPYSPAGSVVVVSTANTSIGSLDDLSGKIVGSQTGSTPEKNAQAWDSQLKTLGKSGYSEYRSYTDFPTIYEDVRTGRLDAAVAGYSTSSLLIKERPNDFKIVAQNGAALPIGPPSYFSVAVPKGEKAFTEYINSRIRAWKQDGTLASVHRKWYGESRDDLDGSIAHLPDPWEPPQ